MLCPLDILMCLSRTAPYLTDHHDVDYLCFVTVHKFKLHRLALMQHAPGDQQPCKFFLTNSCKKGSACRFSHEITLPSRRQPCKYYKMGTCIFGKTCRAIHADEPLSEPCKFWRAGKCTRGVGCMHAHDTDVNPGKLSQQQPQMESSTHVRIALIWLKNS